MTVSFEDLLFFDCYVDQVGPSEDGSIAILLSDVNGEFTQVWFGVLENIRPAVLQTALAAVQNNLTCRVALTGTEENSELYRIHAINAAAKGGRGRY
ncbi:hypothetical protein BJ973_003781 [Actinoplanes tereljensis]|uniref:Uncharacterized protein n=1 Tax=Paractinoplanes tereljensis TaxID=571912 RepID=A0A919TXP2_9ACTN|nr:hypothetical protein [Actinoplanes tereljensis]GIF25504.1 hypothetical protein Ate02nite_82340 [Actinoplanes tereljensis]